MTNIYHQLGLLSRLLVALILAGALGWERESRGKAAGLRTHMLVGMSAALFVILGEEMVNDFANVNAPLRLDPIVVLSAVASGISFLGAGSIFVSRDSTVKGLTTAASILATSAVGIAAGLERYVLAVGSTLLLLIVLSLLGRLEPRDKGEEEQAKRNEQAGQGSKPSAQ